MRWKRRPGGRPNVPTRSGADVKRVTIGVAREMLAVALGPRARAQERGSGRARGEAHSAGGWQVVLRGSVGVGVDVGARLEGGGG